MSTLIAAHFVVQGTTATLDSSRADGAAPGCGWLVANHADTDQEPREKCESGSHHRRDNR